MCNLPNKANVTKPMLARLLGILALLVYLTLPPRDSVRFNGRYYRTRDSARLGDLEALRTISLRVVGGLPWSPRREWALWRLGRCVFVARDVAWGEEGTPLALTVDKGREIEICLDYTDRQALYFVLIHELAHVMSRSIGHTEEFYRNMDRLILSARSQEIYTGTRRDVMFCGVHIHLDK